MTYSECFEEMAPGPLPKSRFNSWRSNPSKSILELKNDVKEAREKYGRGSEPAHIAFRKLEHGYRVRGRCIDELPFRSPDERERFFAKIVNGPSGHAYWTGGLSQVFQKNRGSQKVYVWWWEQLNGPLPPGNNLSRTCTDKQCVHPQHREVASKSRNRYTDEQLIGAFQTLSLRLGRAPTMNEWDTHAEAKMPSRNTLQGRLGAWGDICRRAGFEPPNPPRVNEFSREELLQSIHFLHDYLGHWPSSHTFTKKPEIRRILRENKFPSTATTHRRLFGSYAAAVEAAKNA